MYSAEDEQEPALKKLQKTSKILMFVDTDPGAEYEQGPTIKQPQKALKISGDEDPQETSPALVKPAKIPNFAAASWTYILTKGIRKGKQCRFRASDEAGKFCHHHKQTPN